MLLALDLSLSTGWACGAPGEVPRYGTWLLPHVSPAAAYVALENQIADAVALFRPSVLVLEAPLNLTRQTHQNTARQQFGLAAVAMAEGYRAELEIVERSVQTVRARVLGMARPEEPKKAVKEWAVRAGYRPGDDNAADALALWTYEAQLRAGRMPKGRRAA